MKKRIASMSAESTSIKSEQVAEGPSPQASDSRDLTLPKRPWLRKTTPWTRIINHGYQGKGTSDAPYVVVWLPSDPDSGFRDLENPNMFGFSYKWATTILAALSTMIVSMGSSMLSAAMEDVMKEFPGRSSPVYIMVTSAYIIGFVIGPLLWAPCSEVFGRRTMFIFTYIPFTLFNAAASGCKSIEALLVMRLLAGTFGCSSMTNSGGTIADMFDAHQRGLAMGVFAAAPFLGPAIGPVIGGFLSEGSSWHWVAAVIAILSFALTVAGGLFIPETYAPVLLRRRAARLSKATGKEYRSAQDVLKPLDKKELFTRQLKKPWDLMFKEPIVALMALYLSVIYAILYMQFTAFPLIFQGQRGWSPGLSGLAFVGITIGAFGSLGYIVFFENPAYVRKHQAAGGYLAPEARLPSVILGAILLPLGLIIFAFTCVPITLPWIACIIATVPYGAGIVFVFLGVSNYLVDAYLMYAASVLAGGTVMRSAFGVVLPLFTTDIYDSLGVRWASALIAFLALAFAPVPMVFYVWGAKIRRSSKAAREADDLGRMLAARSRATPSVPVLTRAEASEKQEDEERAELASVHEQLLEASGREGAGQAVSLMLERVESIQNGKAVEVGEDGKSKETV